MASPTFDTSAARRAFIGGMNFDKHNAACRAKRAARMAKEEKEAQAFDAFIARTKGTLTVTEMEAVQTLRQDLKDAQDAGVRW